jgi:hypothetical protein
MAYPKNTNMSTGEAKAEPASSEALPTSNASKAAAVFAVPELLFLVLEAVPRQHRTSLRHVSKAWQAAVSKIGHVIEPIGCLLIPDDLRPWLPLYLPGVVFKINRVFINYVSCISATDIPTYNMYLDKGFVETYQLDHEFVTNPPMTQLGIYCGSKGQVASLRVQGGIRVGHLRECLSKLDSTPFSLKASAAYSRPN